MAGALSVAIASLFVASQAFGGPVRYIIVSGHSMEPLLHTGDVALVLPRGSYRLGDVIAFRVPAGEPGAGALVIHRMVGGAARSGYLTQGDNRGGRDPWRPQPEDVIGRMAFHIPKVGLALAFLGSPFGLGLAAASLAFVAVAGSGKQTGRNLEAELEPVVDIEPLSDLGTERADVSHSGRAPAPALAVAAIAVVGLAVLAVRQRRRRT